MILNFHEVSYSSCNLTSSFTVELIMRITVDTFTLVMLLSTAMGCVQIPQLPQRKLYVKEKHIFVTTTSMLTK